MGKYVQRITYKGKEILFMDSSNKGEEEILAAWEEAKQEAAKELNGCLALVDATNVRITLAITNKAREAGATLKGNPRNRIAFISTSGLLKSTAQVHSRAFGVKAHICATLEEGKEWLVSEDEKSEKR
jgi:hypothetical protein